MLKVKYSGLQGSLYLPSAASLTFLVCKTVLYASKNCHCQPKLSLGCGGKVGTENSLVSNSKSTRPLMSKCSFSCGFLFFLFPFGRFNLSEFIRSCIYSFSVFSSFFPRIVAQPTISCQRYLTTSCSHAVSPSYPLSRTGHSSGEEGIFSEAQHQIQIHNNTEVFFSSSAVLSLTAKRGT